MGQHADSVPTVYYVPLGSALGEHTPLEQVAELSAEQVERYRGFGYRACRIAEQDVFSLCHTAITGNDQLTAAPEHVDTLAFAIEPMINSSNNWMINEEAWKARDIRWLIQRSHLHPERILGFSFYNCATFLGITDTVTQLIRSGATRTALGLVAGAANPHSPRVPHAFHIQSDGACGFLLTADAEYWDKYRIASHLVRYVNPGEFRSIDGTVDEGTYFSLKALKIRATVEDLLAQAGVKPADVDRLVVQNLGLESMQKYARLCGIGEQALWTDSLALNGHIIGADSTINLDDWHRAAPPTPGTLALVLGTSGMSWGAMLLEYVG